MSASLAQEKLKNNIKTLLRSLQLLYLRFNGERTRFLSKVRSRVFKKFGNYLLSRDLGITRFDKLQQSS